MKGKEKNYQKGITLIALVITIIVLLILAGVTLSIVFNGGIIDKSQTAVDKYTEESAREKLSLVIFNYKMGVITGEGKSFEAIIEEMGGTANHNEGTSGTPVIPEVKKYKVTVVKEENGIEEVTVTGGGEVEEGQSVEIIATVASGYVFNGWTITSGTGTIADATSASTTVTPTSEMMTIKATATAVYKAYSIGDTVTVGGEQFYVLADSDSTQAEVTLIAKYNLNKAGTAQSPNAAYGDTCCKFSSTNYWKDDTEKYSDLNDLGKESEGDAIAKAKEYAKTVTGDSTNTTGRLLTYNEANTLNTAISTDETGKISTMLWGKENTQSDGNHLYYWLGSAGGANGVWGMVGSRGDFISYNFADGSRYGVRPVITVFKSKI